MILRNQHLNIFSSFQIKADVETVHKLLSNSASIVFVRSEYNKGNIDKEQLAEVPSKT